jgi:hypothetical protein
MHAHAAGRGEPPKPITLEFLLGDSETIRFLGNVSAMQLLIVRLLPNGKRLDYNYFPVEATTYDYFPVDATALRTSSCIKCEQLH